MALMSRLRSFVGLGEDQAAVPPTPEDYLAGSQEQGANYNPVADDTDVIDKSGPEPELYGSALSDSEGAVPGDLPEGPESSMSDTERAEMYDLLSQRAQERKQRSQHFQQKAREMAGAIR